ncbi:AAA family ATPase [Pseudonocardia zijingensis]|uniref:AAA family ATPase n=1 Tax=Pseudonocardia zijingensis TaxID=153376 RepID=UPI0036199B5B
MLVGRRAEHAALEQLLARAEGGDSGVLVVCGEAGIGKTALLQHVRGSAVAAGFRVEDAAGVEAEAEFAFAGLHQLCAPMLARAAELPEPQQAALGVAFGMRGGAAPDRFLVGLAVLSLLAEVAEDGPLLCVVDDAQWLDQASAQVLAFVARRVAAERVVLVFALRDPGVTEVDAFAGLPELRLAGLGESDARALLATAVRAPLDDVVRDRIVAEARGNPLALLELPRGAPEVQLAGGFELSDVVSVARRVEDGFLLARAACRPIRSCCWWWPRPSRPAMRRCCGARPRSSGSPRRRPRRRRPPGCWSSTPGCGSGTRSCAPRSTGRPHRPTSAERTAHWPPSPTRRSTPTAAPGTGRRRWWAPTRRSPLSWSVRPDGPAPVADRPPRRRS